MADQLRPRVFVYVDGGVAYVHASDGVEVAFIDYDVTEIWRVTEGQIEPQWVEAGTDEERYAQLPERFKGLPDAEMEMFLYDPHLNPNHPGAADRLCRWLLRRHTEAPVDIQARPGNDRAAAKTG